MEAIRVKARVGEDGLLKLQLPLSAHGAECEVIVLLEPEKEDTSDSHEDLQTVDWETFVRRTFGSLAHEPMERPEQPPLDERESIE